MQHFKKNHAELYTYIYIYIFLDQSMRRPILSQFFIIQKIMNRFFINSIFFFNFL